MLYFIKNNKYYGELSVIDNPAIREGWSQSGYIPVSFETEPDFHKRWVTDCHSQDGILLTQAEKDSISKALKEPSTEDSLLNQVLQNAIDIAELKLNQE